MNDDYLNALYDCRSIATQFDELEQELLKDFEICFELSKKKKNSKPVLMLVALLSILVTFGVILLLYATVVANLAEESQSMFMEIGLPVAAFIAFGILPIPMVIRMRKELARIFRVADERAKQMNAVAEQWHVVVKKLKRLRRDNMMFSEDYTTLTGPVNKHIRSFKKRYPKMRMEVYKQGKTEGELKYEHFEKIFLGVYAGVAAVGIGVALAGLKMGSGIAMKDFGSRPNPTNDIYINKETGAEYNYDPRY